MITSEWPTTENPHHAPFIVDEVATLRDFGHEVKVFAFRGSGNIINYFHAWKSVREQYCFSEFDLIHAQFGQSAFLAWASKRPLVVTFRGSDLHGFIGRKGELTYKGIILRCMSILSAYKANERILVSKSLAKYLPNHLSYHIIPGSINRSVFFPIPKQDARLRLGLPLERKIVLFPADPNRPVKRYDLACSAAEEVRKKIDFDLITLSNVKHELVPLFMNAADAMIFTSSNEGSPNVIKEALACNLPIVSVNVGDVSDNISQIKECYLCENDSPSAIAHGLERILQNGERISGEYSDEKFERRNHLIKLNEVYCKAVMEFNSRVKRST